MVVCVVVCSCGYWHSLHSVQCLCNGLVSIHLSVPLSNCPIIWPLLWFCCCWPSVRRYWSIAARPALSSSHTTAQRAAANESRTPSSRCHRYASFSWFISWCVLAVVVLRLIQSINTLFVVVCIVCIVCRVYVTIGCPSICLIVPSFGGCMPLLWFCCCWPGGQEILIDCCTAGAQQ